MRLILSVGMPRAGSGWHYNLIHDLVVASGGRDAREVRQRYFLRPILTQVNCNVGTLAPHRLIPVMIPVWLGSSYVVKTHAAPSPLALNLTRRGLIKPIYIYRDPRDAALSAFEYGERKREKGLTGAFTDLTTIEAAIEFMRPYVRISDTWINCDPALHVRYEDLLGSYWAEALRLLDDLGFDPEAPHLQKIVEKYRPERGRKGQKGTHFYRGVIGRHRQIFTPEQKEACLEFFGPYLERMGYPLG